MAQQTEAACLLETGALYHTRVMLRAAGEDPVFAGFKQAADSLYFGDEPIYHFDREGRWQRAFIEGVHYLKGLDGAVQAIERVREGESLVLRRRTLSSAEAAGVDARVRSACVELLRDVASGRFERVDPPPRAQPLDQDALRGFLERAARWDAAAWLAQGEAYRATYGPLPFLPPDIPGALVVQATVGHPGAVAFGGGRAAAHRVRTAAEFADHARAVAALVGRRLPQYRILFLAGGDVLSRPAPEVAAYLEALALVFPIGQRESRSNAAGSWARLAGVHAFLDDPGASTPGADDWRRFRALGLLRINIGIESGELAVRALYGKSWRDEALARIVADAKGAGIGVGLIVVAGAGGEEHAAGHVAATAALLNGLELGPGDLVSVLDANELRDPDAGDPGFTPLSAARTAEQQAELKQALGPLRGRTEAKVAVYSLEKQRLAAT